MAYAWAATQDSCWYPGNSHASRELGAHEALMIVGCAIDQVAENFLLRPSSGGGLLFGAGVGDSDQALRRGLENRGELSEQFVHLFQNHFGKPGIAGAIGGADHQQVFAGREAGQVEGELFVQRIDDSIGRLRPDPAGGVERIFATAQRAGGIGRLPLHVRRDAVAP